MIKLTKLKRMTHWEIVRFATQWLAGMIFTIQDLGDPERGYLHFLPLKDLLVDDSLTLCGTVWEYRHKATPQGLDGYPIFASCYLMHPDDFALAKEELHLQSAYQTERADELEVILEEAAKKPTPRMSIKEIALYIALGTVHVGFKETSADKIFKAGWGFDEADLAYAEQQLGGAPTAEEWAELRAEYERLIRMALSTIGTVKAEEPQSDGCFLSFENTYDRDRFHALLLRDPRCQTLKCHKGELQPVLVVDHGAKLLLVFQELATANDVSLEYDADFQFAPMRPHVTETRNPANALFPKGHPKVNCAVPWVSFGSAPTHRECPNYLMPGRLTAPEIAALGWVHDGASTDISEGWYCRDHRYFPAFRAQQADHSFGVLPVALDSVPCSAACTARFTPRTKLASHRNPINYGWGHSLKEKDLTGGWYCPEHIRYIAEEEKSEQ